MTNPKQLAAQAAEKAHLDLLEHAADVEIAKVLKHGADKYGKRNFYLSPIQARVYAAAIKRHIGEWLDGEDLAPDSGISHLAHIGANVHVLFAAMKAGTFIDDRAPDQAAHDEAQNRLANGLDDALSTAAGFGSSGRVIPIRRVDTGQDTEGPGDAA